MKAILVIDLPKSCADCQLADFGRCWGTRSYVHMRFDDIPVVCPLKPMPQKMDEDEDVYNIKWFKYGFNTCIEVLEK